MRLAVQLEEDARAETGGGAGAADRSTGLPRAPRGRAGLRRPAPAPPRSRVAAPAAGLAGHATGAQPRGRRRRRVRPQASRIIGDAAAFFEVRVPAEKDGEAAPGDGTVVIGLDHLQHVARPPWRARSIVMRWNWTRPASDGADRATRINRPRSGGPARSWPRPRPMRLAAPAPSGTRDPERVHGISRDLPVRRAPWRQALHLAPCRDRLHAEGTTLLTRAGLEMIDDAPPQARRDVAVEEGLQAHARSVPHRCRLVVVGRFGGGLPHVFRSGGRALWLHLLAPGRQGMTARDRGICAIVHVGLGHHACKNVPSDLTEQSQAEISQDLAERTQRPRSSAFWQNKAIRLRQIENSLESNSARLQSDQLPQCEFIDQVPFARNAIVDDFTVRNPQDQHSGLRWGSEGAHP